MSAIFSPCGKYRHRLEREIQAEGITVLFIGVNPSTAGADAEDATTNKWRGFSLRNGIRRYIVVNLFDYCSTDVKQLAQVSAPISDDNLAHVVAAISDADVIVPCWGSRDKLPKTLRHHAIRMRRTISESGKRVLIFGLTKSGDPKHPLMLGYDTPLVQWREDGCAGQPEPMEVL